MSDADERRRNLRRESLDGDSSTIHTHAETSVSQCVCPSFETNSANQTKEAAWLQRKAEQLSELPADDAQGDAVEYPVRMGRARKLVRNPSLAMPPPMHTIPASTVNTMVSEMYRGDPRRPAGRRLPRPARTSHASGAMISCRDVPKKA